MWNPSFYSQGGLVFRSIFIFLVTCCLHDISTYWLINLVIYWLWLDLLTEEWLVLTVWLLVDCMTVLVYFLVYLLWTLWWIPNLPCIAQTARGVGTSLWRHELWDRMSNAPINVNPVRGECGQGVGIWYLRLSPCRAFDRAKRPRGRDIWLWPTEAWYQFRSGYQVRSSRLSESHAVWERYEVFICFNRHNSIL